MSDGGKAVAEEASASERLFLAVVAAAVFLSVMTATMVTVVTPAIGEEFGASEARVGWIVTGFMLVMAIGIPLYGRVSDFFGVRRVFSVALVLFAVGGLVCAFAQSLPVLVFGRAVQAAGDAAIPALAVVAVAKVLPPGKRGGAMGLVGSSAGIGAAVGPIAGGVVEQVADWRLLFWGTLFLMLGLIPFAWRVLPDDASEGERRFDLAGGILLGLGAALFLFGVTQGQVEGFASFSSWGGFLGAALALAGFARRITTAPHPFVSADLFKNRAYVVAVVVGFFAMFAQVSMFVFVPLLVVEANGLSAGAAGLVLTPGAVAMALLSPMAGGLSDRIGTRIPILVGLAVMGISIFFVSAFGAGASPALVSAGMLGFGVGFALANPAATNAAAGALAGEEVGAGMGIFQGLYFLGGGTGPALVGALLAARAEGGFDAINPLYALDAAPYSDAFLAMVLALVLALAVALVLRSPNHPRSRQPEG